MKVSAFVLVLLFSIFSSHSSSSGQIVDPDVTILTEFSQRSDSGTWTALGSGLNGAVFAIAVSGTDVYAGGYFTDAGGDTNCDRIARWDGSQWQALGTGLNDAVLSIAISGSDVYVGGLFTDAGGNPNADYVARWDGSQWQALGAGTNYYVWPITLADSELYVGGNFTSASSIPNTERIARWDGTQWHALGTGLSAWVYALTISGSDVYAGGDFYDAAGNPNADRIARWDGTQWHAVGTGLNNQVYTLVVSGTDIYAGGWFVDAGGNPTADRIARWDGTQWHTVGGGLNNFVYAIAFFGTDIFVGGWFSEAGGNPDANRITRWDGTQWNSLGAGLTGEVRVIKISGTDIYAGGYFTNAGGNPNADRIARWTPYRDVSSVGFISPLDTVFPSVQSIIGVVANIGSITENFNVHCIVTDQTDAAVLDTTVNTLLLTDMHDTINFGQVNMVHGQTYTLTMATLLSEDMNVSNDTLIFQTVCRDTINSVEEDISGGSLEISFVYSSYVFSDNKLRMNLFVPSVTDLMLAIYDITGREISSLYLEELNSGNHNLVWNCIDHNGTAISSGVYFFRLEVSERAFNGKFILME